MADLPDGAPDDAGGGDVDEADAGDAGAGDGGGGGVDGGGRDGGLVIRFSSVTDSAAGECAAPGYRLRSVTGWTAGFRWTAGGYTLRSGQPYAR